MTAQKKMSAEGAELLSAVREMKAGRKGRVYTPEQLRTLYARGARKPARKKRG